ncbi:hypothetical protein BB558_004532 [Smittium angustum]|uniref:Nucleolar 27S pre-rRNA processing Urb2/Npa2 C-terminal domain-containing protein n=1 Tax=Smittium angustum TaxID=133377 RepID=A0A2U1J339_SMIAN|nr:hypothetical protein BB558_004532 [Smittium angustum]
MNPWEIVQEEGFLFQKDLDAIAQTVNLSSVEEITGSFKKTTLVSQQKLTLSWLLWASTNLKNQKSDNCSQQIKNERVFNLLRKISSIPKASEFILNWLVGTLLKVSPKNSDSQKSNPKDFNQESKSKETHYNLSGDFRAYKLWHDIVKSSQNKEPFGSNELDYSHLFSTPTLPIIISVFKKLNSQYFSMEETVANNTKMATNENSDNLLFTHLSELTLEMIKCETTRKNWSLQFDTLIQLVSEWLEILINFNTVKSAFDFLNDLSDNSNESSIANHYVNLISQTCKILVTGFESISNHKKVFTTICDKLLDSVSHYYYWKQVSFEDSKTNQQQLTILKNFQEMETNLELCLQLGLFRVDTISAFTTVISQKEIELNWNLFEKSTNQGDQIIKKTKKQGSSAKASSKQKSQAKLQVYQSILFEKIDSMLNCSKSKNSLKFNDKQLMIGNWKLIPLLMKLIIRSSTMISMIHNGASDVVKNKYLDDNQNIAILTSVTNAAAIATSETLGFSALCSLVYLFFGKLYNMISDRIKISLCDLNDINLSIDKSQWGCLTQLVCTYIENNTFGISTAAIVNLNDPVANQKNSTIEHWMSVIICPLLKNISSNCGIPAKNNSASQSDLFYTIRKAFVFNPSILLSYNMDTKNTPNLQEVIHSLQSVPNDALDEAKVLLNDILSTFSQTRQIDLLVQCIIKEIWVVSFLTDDGISKPSDNSLVNQNILVDSWFISKLVSTISEYLPAPLVPSLISKFSEAIQMEIKDLESILSKKKSNGNSKKRTLSSHSASRMMSELRLEGLVLIFVHFIQGVTLGMTTTKQHSQLFTGLANTVETIMPKLLELSEKFSSELAAYTSLLLFYSSIESASQNVSADSWVKKRLEPGLVVEWIPKQQDFTDDNLMSKCLVLEFLINFKSFSYYKSVYGSYEHLFEDSNSVNHLGNENENTFKNAFSSKNKIIKFISNRKSKNTNQKDNNHQNHWDGFPNTISANNLETVFFKICTDRIELVSEDQPDNEDLLLWILSTFSESFDYNNSKSIYEKQHFEHQNDSTHNSKKIDFVLEKGIQNNITLESVSFGLINSENFFEIQSLRNVMMMYNIAYVENISKNYEKFNFETPIIGNFVKQLVENFSTLKKECYLGDQNETTSNKIFNKKVPFIKRNADFDGILDNTLSYSYFDITKKLTSNKTTNFKGTNNDSNGLERIVTQFINQIYLWKQFPRGYFESDQLCLSVAVCLYLDKFAQEIIQNEVFGQKCSEIYFLLSDACREWVYIHLSGETLKNRFKSQISTSFNWGKWIGNTTIRMNKSHKASSSNKSNSILLFNKIFSNSMKISLTNNDIDGLNYNYEILTFLFSEYQKSKDINDLNYKTLESILGSASSILGIFVSKNEVNSTDESSITKNNSGIDAILMNISKMLLKNSFSLIKHLKSINLGILKDEKSITSILEMVYLIQKSVGYISFIVDNNVALEKEMNTVIEINHDFEVLIQKWLDLSSVNISKFLNNTNHNLDPKLWVSIGTKLLNIQEKPTYSSCIGDKIDAFQKNFVPSETKDNIKKNIDNSLIETPMEYYADTDKLLAFSIQLLMSLQILDLKNPKLWNEKENDVSNNSKTTKYYYFGKLNGDLRIDCDLDTVTLSIKSILNNLGSNEQVKVFKTLLQVLAKTSGFENNGSDNDGGFEILANSSKLQSLLFLIHQILPLSYSSNRSDTQKMSSLIFSSFLHLANNSIMFTEEAVQLLDLIYERILNVNNGIRVSVGEISIIVDIIYSIINRPLYFNPAGIYSKDTNQIKEDFCFNLASELFSSCCKLVSSCFKHYPDHIMKCIPSVITLLRSLLHCFVNFNRKCDGFSTNLMYNLFWFSPLPTTCASEYSRLIGQFTSLRVGSKPQQSSNANQAGSKRNFVENTKGTASGNRAVILAKYSPLILSEYCVIMGGGLLELETKFTKNIHPRFLNFLNETQKISRIQTNLDFLNNNTQQKLGNNEWLSCNANIPPVTVGLEWRPIPVCSSGISIKNDKTNTRSSSLYEANKVSRISKQKFERNQLYGIISNPETREVLIPALYSILDLMSDSERDSLMGSFGSQNSFSIADNKGAKGGNDVYDYSTPFYELPVAIFNKNDYYKQLYNFYTPSNWSGSKEILKALHKDYMQFYKFKGSF